nr:restriction endonuclease subunit S [Azospirillum humicireducens]
MYGGFQKIGRTGVLQRNAATNRAVSAILADRQRVNPAFLNYCLVRSQPAWKKIAASSRKDPNITKQDILEFQIPLPPLSEQRRIAEILSSVDEAVASTQAVIEQTRTVQQSVLKRLLSKGIGHSRFKQTEFGAIPEPWKVVPLRTVAHIQTGVAKGKKDIHDPVELPYLRVANVQDGHIDLIELKTITVSASQVERYSLRPGDVLMTEGGDFDKLGRGDGWKG